MAYPWIILGLDVSQRDQRSIKRAYAKLLKQHRPDQDPEGFRRLHDAYQRALQMAADDDDDEAPVQRPVLTVVPIPAVGSQDSSSSTEAAPGITSSTGSTGPSGPEPFADRVAEVDQHPTPAADGPVSTSPAAESSTSTDDLTTTPWQRGLSELDAAAAQRSGPLREAAVMAAFRQLAGLVTAGQGNPATLALLLARYLPAGRQVWRHIFTDDDLLAELRRGESELAGHTLRGCFEIGDWQRLRGFAERWMELDADELQSGDAVALTRVLAVWLAPFDYVLADRLVGYLPMHLRRSVDHELDTLLAVGRDLKEFPESSRAYLCALLAGHEPADDEQVRWRTGALLSQLAPDALARRVLEQRCAGHFAGLSAPLPSSSVNLLSILFIVVGMVLFTALVTMAVALGEKPAWKANQTFLLLGSIVASVPGFLLLRWVYRKLLPRYQAGLRPWLWQHLGPFDAVLWLSWLYLWLGFGLPVAFQEVLPNAVVATWLLLMPFLGIILIHHIRRLLRKHRAELPRWDMALSGLRELLREMSQKVTVSQALHWMGRFLAWWVGFLPALGGAALAIGGLAWCRPFFLHGEVNAALTMMFWSGAFVFLTLTLQALNVAWWQAGRTPWWKPLLPLAWCAWIPLLPWLVTWGLVWSGHAHTPPRVATTVMALVVAVCLPAIVGRWWRRRQRATDESRDRTG